MTRTAHSGKRRFLPETQRRAVGRVLRAGMAALIALASLPATPDRGGWTAPRPAAAAASDLDTAFGAQGTITHAFPPTSGLPDRARREGGLPGTTPDHPHPVTDG